MTEKKPSFADLFEAEPFAPSARARVCAGDRVEAPVVRVGKDSVFVELPGRATGWFESKDFRAPDGTLAVGVGDVVTGFALEVMPDGSVRLGRALARGSASNAALEQARDAGIPVEGKVVAVNKGGLEVDVDGVRAFCPSSQADVRFNSDLSALVGRTLTFRVMEIRSGGRGVVLSRRAVLEEEVRQARDRALSALAVGQVLRGTVTSVRDFGAFVDLGGIEGLVPLTELSHERGLEPRDVLRAGDVIEVQVREIREVTPKHEGDSSVKVTLSLKALEADPWTRVDDVAHEGKVIDGQVVRLTDFGAFVRLGPGIEGLLHVSELPGKVTHPTAVLRVGQRVRVVVQRVDREARRISLAPAPDGIECGATVSPPRLVVGAVVNAIVDHIEPFGVFVQVEGTKGRAGRGLVPNAELGLPRGADVRRALPEGTKLVVKVLEAGDRMRMSVKAVREDEERAEFDVFRERGAAPAKLGTLGDLLRKR
jgi:small subunit ribosomal protein S1